MKAFITAIALILPLTGCQLAQSPPIERRSNEAEIREHIVGEWTVSDKSDGFWYPKFIIAADGRLFSEKNGTKVLIGTWVLDHQVLRVTHVPASLRVARTSDDLMNECDYYPVIYADDHELVLTPGISVAGRLRFAR